MSKVSSLLLAVVFLFSVACLGLDQEYVLFAIAGPQAIAPTLTFGQSVSPPEYAVILPSMNVALVLRPISRNEWEAFQTHAVSYERIEYEMLSSALLEPRLEPGSIGSLLPGLQRALELALNAISGFTVFSASPALLVINEAEIGPASAPAKDWVELLNKGDSPVDLSGWQITRAGFDEDWEALPAVTVEPRGYFVYTFPNSSFGAGNISRIRLRTPNGLICDETPEGAIRHGYRDDYTWQRFPDGLNTESPEDWAFHEATPGKPND